MDTRLKSSKPAVIITCIALFLVLSSSLIMVGLYPTIQGQVDNYSSNYFVKDSFVKPIVKLNYTLFSEYQIQLNPTFTPFDILFHKNITLREDYNKQKVNEEIYGWKQEILQANSNLKYLAVEKGNKKVISNFPSDEKIFQNDKLQYEALLKNYRFLVQVDFDETGNFTISQIHGANRSLFSNRMIDLNQIQLTQFSYENMNAIKNMIFVYAVPYQLGNDVFASDFQQHQLYSYKVLSRNLMYLFIGVILVFALIIPKKRIMELSWLKKTASVWIEIWIMIFLYLVIWMLNTTPGIAIMEYFQGQMNSFMGIPILQTHASQRHLIILHLMMWCICFGIVLLSIWMIRYAKNIGISNYVKQSSLLVQLFKISRKYLLRFMQYLEEFHFNDKYNKRLLLVIIINAMIVGLFCTAWLFGIIGVILYSIMLFVIARKMMKSNEKKYQKLVDATERIAKGDLDAKVEENLGVFEPLNRNLKQIQKGFKSAVEQELNSQKMRTELISNVSHDLKTPLTAIISYVDLMKNKNLSEQKRKEYIAILERKAQRLQYLIEDLFEISKLSSENINFHYENIDVVSLMNQALFEVEENLNKAQLTVKRNFPENKVILSLDSMRTYRVFENLLMNICKYAMPSSRVFIDIIDQTEQVEIILKNISEHEIDFSEDEIVERFTRGDKSRNTEGSGLGLAIAKSFIELQGGKFKIILDGDLFKAHITFLKPLQLSR